MKTRKMKKIKGKAVLALTGALVSALAYATDYGPANNLGEEGTSTPPDEYVARVEAMQEVDLLPQVDGYIEEIKFKEGDIVQAGTVLYVLDDERYRAVANQRRADLEFAEAEARRAERYWARMQKADARGITQRERDEAEAGAEKAKAAVYQAKANLLVAEYELKKTKVIAPISGQIGKTSAHVGDYVALSKGALARIVQVDPIRVTFPLTDRAYLRWRAALRERRCSEWRFRLILPNGEEYAHEGTWDFDDNEMSWDMDTIIMRVSFPNPDRLLVPNGYVKLLVEPRISELGVKRSELKKAKVFKKVKPQKIGEPEPPKRPEMDPPPDLKIPDNVKEYGKATAHDKPLPDYEKLLQQGYRIGARNRIASSEAQRCVSLIQAAIHREWNQESFNWHSGLRPIKVDFQLGAGGIVRGFAIQSGSGDAEVDRTALNALKRLKDKGGIPALSKSFIEQYPQLTITMEPTQGR